MVKGAIDKADAHILRVPGTVPTLLWRHLKKRNLPYGVEIVGDPWDSLALGCVKSVFRPILRMEMTWALIRQCRSASAASYVTEYSLQKRYPPGCWSTHYSSVELPKEAIIDDSALEAKLAGTKAKLGSGIPLRISHVGMMEHLYKAPDVLLEAAAVCIGKGLNIELVFIGDGRFKPELEQKARKLGIAQKVRFLGKLPGGRTIYDELDKTDLYILPSRQEGLPRSVIEAMGRGLPCIGSTAGGTPELLDMSDMVAPGDTVALAAEVESVIKNPSRLEEMARRNLKTARKYSADELNRRRIEFYKRIMDATNAL